MSSRLIPAAALLLAVAWLLAQAFRSPLLAALTAAAGLTLSCLVALTRRSRSRARALAAGLSLLGALVLASVLILLFWAKQGPIVLIILALVVVIAGIVAPLLYARTFEKMT